jgi:hypothetical protein
MDFQVVIIIIPRRLAIGWAYKITIFTNWLLDRIAMNFMKRDDCVAADSRGVDGLLHSGATGDEGGSDGGIEI